MKISNYCHSPPVVREQLYATLSELLIQTQRNLALDGHLLTIGEIIQEYLTSWYGRPNPEDRINGKPKDRIFDRRTE